MGPRRRAVYGALIGMLLGAAAFLAHDGGLTARWEYAISDLYVRTRPPHSGPGDVLVVGITRECMEDPDLGALPWPRRKYARLLDNLKALGASTVCFDVFFPQPSPPSPDGVDDDADLARAIRGFGKVILPVFDRFRGTERGVVSLQGSLPFLEREAAGLGHINVLPDPDGIVRRCPLRVGSLTHGYTQLGVAGAALHLTGAPRGGAVEPPIAADGSLRVPWRPETAWRPGVNVATFAEAYHGRLTRQQVEGKIVFIGQTAPGLPNADIINSPFGARFGVFCQADIAQGVVSRDFIRPWSDGAHLTVLLLIGAALGAVMSTLRVGPILACALGVLVGEPMIGVALVRSSGVLIEVVPTLAMVTLSVCLSLAYGLGHRAAEARRWAQAMEVLRTTGLDTGRTGADEETVAEADALGVAGSLAATLRVPQAIPHTVLAVLASALGARHAFMRFAGRDGQSHWIPPTPDGPGEQRVWELAKRLAELEQERGPSLVLPQLQREPRVRGFADVADTALVLRLTLGEQELGKVILCGKRPTAISNGRRFGMDDLRVALALSPQAALLLDHARLHSGLYAALRDACATLASAMGARDEYTSGHSARVAFYAVFLARQLGLPEWCLEAVELGALLHDIGKIAMDEGILRGSGTLDDADLNLMRRHPDIGAAIFSHMDELQALLPAIRHHHERYDGDGYPEGLAGTEISLLARIVGLADAFDAMTFRRPYRDRALTFEAACDDLLRNAGAQFDPELVRRFVAAATPDLVEQARRTPRSRATDLPRPEPLAAVPAAAPEAAC